MPESNQSPSVHVDPISGPPQHFKPEVLRWTRPAPPRGPQNLFRFNVYFHSRPESRRATHSSGWGFKQGRPMGRAVNSPSQGHRKPSQLEFVPTIYLAKGQKMSSRILRFYAHKARTVAHNCGVDVHGPDSVPDLAGNGPPLCATLVPVRRLVQFQVPVKGSSESLTDP